MDDHRPGELLAVHRSFGHSGHLGRGDWFQGVNLHFGVQDARLRGFEQLLLDRADVAVALEDAVEGPETGGGLFGGGSNDLYGRSWSGDATNL